MSGHLKQGSTQMAGACYAPAQWCEQECLTRCCHFDANSMLTYPRPTHTVKWCTTADASARQSTTLHTATSACAKPPSLTQPASTASRSGHAAAPRFDEVSCCTQRYQQSLTPFCISIVTIVPGMLLCLPRCTGSKLGCLARSPGASGTVAWASWRTSCAPLPKCMALHTALDHHIFCVAYC